MDKARQKELKLAYKQAFPAMGIFAIRNLQTGQTLLDKSTNLTGSLNRHRLELRFGTHRNPALMADWRQHGETGFSFEILEQIKERSEPGFNYPAELERLLANWQAKLAEEAHDRYSV